MFVIDVIPLSAGLPGGTLSYRSKKRLPAGTLVYVPLRARNIPALVVGISSVMEAKANLKAAGFALRGGSLKTAGKLPESIVSAAREVAEYHAAPLGGTLSSLLKDALPNTLSASFSDGVGYEELFIEDAYEKRIAAYRALAVRESGKKRSIVLVAPTRIEAERLKARLKDLHPILVTGTVKAANRAALFAEALRANVVITTPAFAWLPVQKPGAIVIERASAGGYLLPKRPYIDVRLALRALAKHRMLTIAYGDMPLPLELRPKPAAALRAAYRSNTVIIDPREEQKETAFAAVPKELLAAIVATHSTGGRSAVLSVRKGYSPAVVCRDCGNVVRDERGAALSLVVLGTRRILRSADGSTKLDADAVCATCGSWNLLPIGIGVERVVEELTKAIPGADIVRFDTDAVRTSAQAASALKRFSQPGAVAVGTEMMLPFIEEIHDIEVAGIASADSLLALPFWRARERLVRAGLTLRERAEKLYIATRLPDDISIDAIAHPEKTDFFREETEIRTALSYPPFGHLLVLHAEGTKARIDEASAKIEKILAPLTGVRLADRLIKRGRLRLSLIAKVKAGAWPNAALSERLSHLPPWITLHLDPESLW